MTKRAILSTVWGLRQFSARPMPRAIGRGELADSQGYAYKTHLALTQEQEDWISSFTRLLDAAQSINLIHSLQVGSLGYFGPNRAHKQTFQPPAIVVACFRSPCR